MHQKATNKMGIERHFWSTNKLPKLIAALLLYCFSTGIKAQTDYTWWNNKHNWDGTTHWQRYLIVSSNFFGPNALPVPDFHNGDISKSSFLLTSINQHFGKGNFTANPQITYQTPVYSDKVGMTLSMVPIEYYQMDTLTRDERRVRDKDGKGWVIGDLVFSTQIKLMEQSQRRPDMRLIINLKTASGGGLGAARYTDTPGYYFALSAGKSKKLNHKNFTQTRWYGMMGFMAYQTFRTDYRQDDALIYGIGNVLSTNQFDFTSELGGYFGYINNGDRPVIMRLRFNLKQGAFKHLFIQLQQGFHDYPYTSITLGKRFNCKALFN